jgi:hypothetical protein
MPEDVMTEDQQIRALLRSKRVEQPPEGYCEKLLQDIHRRQRSELLQRPLWAIALERFQTFFSEHSMGSASYATAMAVVALAGLFAINGVSKSNHPGTSTMVASAPPAVGQAIAIEEPAEAAPSPRLLSLQNAPFRMAATTEDEAPLADARLLPARASRDTVTAHRPRYVIDTHPVSYEAAKVSFSF